MGINIRTLLQFLLFYLLKEPSAQATDVFTYTSKSTEELKCSFASTAIQVVWTEQRDEGQQPINLFSYAVSQKLAQKLASDSKYNNFNYSIEGTDRFNLVIKNVEQDDAGRYQCNPITTDAVTFDVTVEVLPESININCTELNVCVPSAGKKTTSEMITCNCTAYGLSSSQLEIQWDPVGINSISNTRFGSSSISSKITLQPPSETFSVSCSLTGYRSQIPERLIRASITFSPPVCILTSVCPSNGTNASLTCSCSKGSPVVYGYSFYNSQKLLIKTQSISTLQVNSDKVETFYCKGCNGVFNSQSEPLELNCNGGSAFPWWIFIIICILLLFAAIFLFKKGRKKPAVHQDVEVGKEGGHDEQAATMNLLVGNADKQSLQDVEGSGNTTPTKSSGPAPKEHKKPDDKSRSAGSSGAPNVGPGKVKGPQNNATNKNLAQEIPLVPKKSEENNRKSKETETGKGEKSKSTDDKTITNGEDSTNQAPLTTERTQGDGRADTDTQGMNEDSPSPTNHGQGSLEDLPKHQHPEGNPKDSDSKKPTGAPEIPGKERVTSDSKKPTGSPEIPGKERVTSPSPTNNGQGSSVDPDSKKPTGAPEIPGKERVTSPSPTNNGQGSSVDPDSNKPTIRGKERITPVHPPKITVLL